MNHEQIMVSQIVIIGFQIEFVFIRFDGEEEGVEGFLLYHGNRPEMAHQGLQHWHAIYTLVSN